MKTAQVSFDRTFLQGYQWTIKIAGHEVAASAPKRTLAQSVKQYREFSNAVDLRAVIETTGTEKEQAHRLLVGASS